MTNAAKKNNNKENGTLRNIAQVYMAPNNHAASYTTDKHSEHLQVKAEKAEQKINSQSRNPNGCTRHSMAQASTIEKLDVRHPPLAAWGRTYIWLRLGTDTEVTGEALGAAWDTLGSYLERDTQCPRLHQTGRDSWLSTAIPCFERTLDSKQASSAEVLSR